MIKSGYLGNMVKALILIVPITRFNSLVAINPFLILLGKGNNLFDTARVTLISSQCDY